MLVSRNVPQEVVVQSFNKTHDFSTGCSGVEDEGNNESSEK